MSLSPEDWQNIRVERDGGVTTLRLHTDGGPLVWNARAHEELSDVWTWLSRDRRTRVVVLSGTGDAFCTEIISPSGEKAWHDIWLEGRRMIMGMVELDVPIISIVNGPATVHTELALLADIVLAVPQACFSDRAHVVRGVVPGDGVQAVWRDLIGAGRASYYMLTGESISSDDALRLGMVHELHELSAIEDRARELARPLTALSRETLAYTCAVLREERRKTFGELTAHGLAYAGLARRLEKDPVPESITSDPSRGERP